MALNRSSDMYAVQENFISDNEGHSKLVFE